MSHHRGTGRSSRPAQPSLTYTAAIAAVQHAARRWVPTAIAAAMLTSGLVVGAPLVGSAAPAAPTTATGTAESAEPGGSFANPSTQDRPFYRFWNTGGMMTKESIDQQVASMKAAGAGGFEADNLTGIAQLNNKNPGYDATVHGFGTPEWTRAWTQLFQAGANAGMQVDSLYTPGWSAGIQGLSPDAAGAAKELVYGSVFLDAGQTYADAVPTTSLPSGVTKRVLQRVVAYRCESNCSTANGSVPVLDPHSAFDLTASVSDGSVTYTAPAGSDKYVIVASWMEGTGQTILLANTPTKSYMVDHFAATGSQAIIDYWENHVLTPDLRTAMKATGGSLFFDSLELNRYGVPVRFWTDNFLAEFQKRRGYSLAPYLPTLATADNTTLKSQPAFELAGGVGERVRQDYQQTLSDLFVDNHIDPLKDWAHSYNMTLRGQGYLEWGPGAINDSDTAFALDIPEQEANNANTADNPLFDLTGDDKWRQISSANAQAGRNLVSSETGTFGRADGLARASLVAKMNLQFSVGMNHVVYHGWPDQSPGAAVKWPGYFPFNDQAPDNYGPWSPTFDDDKTINDYVGRMQTVLRRGELRDDVAVFWDGTGAATYDDDTLENSGYSYGFLNNTLATDPSATLKDGKLTQLDYRALVIDASGTSVPMDLATAKKVRAWAKTGFPVVVVGDVDDVVRGYRPGQDAAIRTVLDDLLAQDSVTLVPTRAAVPAALTRAGVNASASYNDQSLVSLHRQSSDSDYYYLFNSSTQATAATVTLTGTGQPYRYDAWSGKVTPVSTYTRVPGGVQVKVDLGTGEGDLIALTPGNADTAKNTCTVAATSSTADEVTATANGALAVRDTGAGSYRTTLSNGKSVSSAIAAVGATVTPKTWNLQVTSWHAGPGGPNDTAKTALDPGTVTADDGGLLPDWQHIDDLSSISGTGTYTTTVDVGPAWTGGTGAYLNLGTVYGTVQVGVNGKALPAVSQLDPNGIDLGDYLHAGANTVTVRVATPIYNAGSGHHDTYGLVGPVVVQPYGQVTVPDQCAKPPTASRAATVTHLRATPTRVVKGSNKRITVTARVTSRANPNGRVTFTVHGHRVATRRLNGTNTAAVKLPKKLNLKLGRHTVTARYLGDAHTKPSVAKVTIRVVRRR